MSKKKMNGKHVPVDDPVFFHKGQVKVGTVLRNVGRSDPRSWRVTRIVSEERNGRGNYRDVDVSVVHKLSDLVYVVSGNQSQMLPFCYLSYSAIWRV